MDDCKTCENQQNALAQSAQRAETAERFADLPVVRLRYTGAFVETMWLGRYLVNRNTPDTFVASVDAAALLRTSQFVFIECAEANRWLALVGAEFEPSVACIEPEPPLEPPAP